MSGTLYRPTLVVLLYHNLFDGLAGGWEQAALDYMTTFEAFRRDVERLERDPRVAFLDPWEFFRRGPEPAGSLSVYLTFDDGYRSTRTAMSYLQSRGIPASVFVNSSLPGTGELAWPEKLLCFFHSLDRRAFQARLGPRSWSFPAEAGFETRRRAFAGLRDLLKTVSTGTREAFLDELYARYGFGLGALQGDPFYESLRLLDWEDLAEVARSGFEVGGHTRTHCMLPLSAAERIEAEIAEDKREIERRLGTPARLFAVPNGEAEDHDDEVIAQCRKSGYELMFSAAGRRANGIGDTYLLDRFDAGSYGLDLGPLLDEVARGAALEVPGR